MAREFRAAEQPENGHAGGRFACRCSTDRQRRLLQGTATKWAGRDRSSGVAVVVPQQTAKPFPALDRASDLADLFTWFDDPVLQALVIAFLVVVDQELADGVSERLLAEEDHAVEQLLSQEPHEPLDVWREVGRPGRQSNRLDSGLFEDVAELRGELRVSVGEDVPLAVEEPVLRIRQVPSDLLHPVSIRVRRAANAEPNDFDCILVLDPAIVGTTLRPFEYNLVSRRMARRMFGGDILPALDGSQALNQYLEFFQTTREGDRMGIVEIV
jgi:hypothetical protein